MQVGTFYVGGLPINLTDFLNVDGLRGIGNIPYNLFYIRDMAGIFIKRHGP